MTENGNIDIVVRNTYSTDKNHPSIFIGPFGTTSQVFLQQKAFIQLFDCFSFRFKCNMPIYILLLFVGIIPKKE